MLEIAICDDNIAFCNDLEQRIHCLAQKNSITANIEIYHTGERLLSSLMNKQSYDLLFLDIELITTSGIVIAKHIREVMNNQSVQIAFVSIKRQYAMELFDVQPINFLIKPIDNGKLLSVFLTTIKLFEQKNFFFTCREIGVGIRRIKVTDIIYFESKGRVVTLWSIESKVLFYDKLDNINVELSHIGFHKIHQSYLVNTQYISKFTYDSVTLISGVTLPISQDNRPTIRKNLLSMKGL